MFWGRSMFLLTLFNGVISRFSVLWLKGADRNMVGHRQNDISWKCWCGALKPPSLLFWEYLYMPHTSPNIPPVFHRNVWTLRCVIKKSRDWRLLRFHAEESMRLYVSMCVFACAFLSSAETMSHRRLECLIEKITNDEAAVKYGTKIAPSS